MKRFVRAAAIAFAAVGLSGCLELSSRTDVNADGSLTVSSDFGIDKAIAGELGKMTGGGKPKADGAANDFASMCKNGFDGALKDMQSALGAGGTGDAPPPATADLPKVTGTVTERGGFVVCTFKETLHDPLKQYADLMAKSGFNSGAASIALLPSGNGYRFTSSLKISDLAQGQTITDEERQGLALVAGMIPREMTTAVTIAGTKVENANGAVAADGKSVTWKIPLHKIFDMRPEAEPITMSADVYFK